MIFLFVLVFSKFKMLFMMLMLVFLVCCLFLLINVKLLEEMGNDMLKFIEVEFVRLVNDC